MWKYPRSRGYYPNFLEICTFCGYYLLFVYVSVFCGDDPNFVEISTFLGYYPHRPLYFSHFTNLLKVTGAVYLSLCPSVSLYLCPRHPCRFLVNICAARNCAQRMRPQVTGSNTLNDSIIRLSFHISGCLRVFCNFCICINFQCGVLVSQCIY